jgi:murein DD-endopeptidase MepM/ murein hydrolase activator NlpD
VSNLNPSPGQTTANLAVVPVGADGSITVSNHAGRVDVVVDVLGWLPAGAPGVSLPSAQRAIDTRTSKPVGRDESVTVGRPAGAANATGLLVNITLTGATEATYLALAGASTSVTNTVPGRTAANLTVLPLGRAGGNVLVNHAGRVDVVVDVLGWLDAASGLGLAEPTRLLDTRVARAFPVAPGVVAGYARDHHDYPATDIIAACGSQAVAPVTGVVLQVRTDDRYDRRTDNPALRGGRSISILGDDGVRYYGSHYQSIGADIVPGLRVTAGQAIAVVGRSGDAVVSGVCHIHFGLSPNCPQTEWSVRRGVIWPWPYLDVWRAGRNRSPAPEIANWLAAHPDACAQAAADPYAKDAG